MKARKRPTEYVVDTVLLLKQMQELKISIAEICRRTNLAHSLVAYVLNGQSTNPTISTLKKITEVLKVDIGKVIVKYNPVK